MIERIEDVPAGVTGFRASGEVTADDYRDVLEPALRAAAETGAIRLLYVLDSKFKMAAGAMVQDVKTGLGLGVSHHSAWKRTAVVTDIDWIAKAMQMFAWMTPGEVAIFEPAQLEEAKAWVAG